MSAIGRRALRIDDPIGATPERRDDTDAGATRNGPDGHRLRELPVAEIHPNPDQPRKRFDDASLRSLAASIGERGVLQPVIVRPRRPAATSSSRASDAGAPPNSPDSPRSPR